MVVSKAEILFLVGCVGDILHEHAAITGTAAPVLVEGVANIERGLELITGKKQDRMTKSMQALVPESYGSIGLTGCRRLLLQFSLARVPIGLGIDFIAAQKAFYRTMVTTGVARLITRAKRVMDVALELEGFSTNSVNDGMAVTPEIWVFDFETANQLESFGGAVILEGSAKKLIETFNAISRL